MSNSSNVETATNIVQFVGVQIAGQFGGRMGKAAASLLLGEPGLMVSATALVKRLEDGTATAADIRGVFKDIAAILAGAAVLTGSSPLWLTAVGVAGGISFINKIFPYSDILSKSRPSPPGGLRPALTRAPGSTQKQRDPARMRSQFPHGSTRGRQNFRSVLCA